MKNIDDVLKRNLSYDYIPENSLNESIRKKAKETKQMKTSTFNRLVAAIAVIVGTLCIGSVTAYAVYKLLPPDKVINQITEGKTTQLEQAFTNGDAIWVNEKQYSKDYCITLLGTVSGKSLLTSIENEETLNDIEDKNTYIVISVENTDGSSVACDEDKLILTTFLNINITNNMVGQSRGGVGFEQDGVYYYLQECSDLEKFANIGVKLCCSKEITNYDTVVYDASINDFKVNPAYEDVCVLFDLPLDKDKADDTSAKQYIEDIKKMTQDQKDDAKNFSNDEFESTIKDEISNYFDVFSKFYIVDDREVLFYGWKDEVGRLYRCDMKKQAFEDCIEVELTNPDIYKQNGNYVICDPEKVIIINSDFEKTDEIETANNSDLFESKRERGKYAVSTRDKKFIYNKIIYDEEGNILDEGIYECNYDGTDGKIIYSFRSIDKYNSLFIYKVELNADESRLFFTGGYFPQEISGEAAKDCHGIFEMENKTITIETYNGSNETAKGNTIITYNSNGDIAESSEEISVFDGQEKSYKLNSKEEACGGIRFSDKGNYYLGYNNYDNVISLYSVEDGSCIDTFEVPESIWEFSYIEDSNLFICTYIDEKLRSSYYEQSLTK